MAEVTAKPDTDPKVTTQGVPPPMDVSGNSFRNLENHGIDMEITTFHANGGEVNKDRGSFPYIMKVQTTDKVEKLVIKESAEIVVHLDFAGENLFNIPILDVRSTKNPNPGEHATTEQAHEVINVKWVVQNVEGKSKATT